SGTPSYMAPEQLAGKEVSVRSDLYALGLILYELFTGQRPFKAGSPQELLAQREHGIKVNPSALCPDLDPAIESVIVSCLAPDPQHRPASARAIIASLPYRDPLAAALDAGETPSPELIAASGDTRTLSPRVAIGGAVAIIAALAGIYLFKGR